METASTVCKYSPTQMDECTLPHLEINTSHVRVNSCYLSFCFRHSFGSFWWIFIRVWQVSSPPTVLSVLLPRWELTVMSMEMCPVTPVSHISNNLSHETRNSHVTLILLHSLKLLSCPMILWYVYTGWRAGNQMQCLIALRGQFDVRV